MNYRKIPVEEFHPTENGKVIVCFNIFENKLNAKGEKMEDLEYKRSHKFETGYVVIGGVVSFPFIVEKIETVTHVIVPVSDIEEPDWRKENISDILDIN